MPEDRPYLPALRFQSLTRVYDPLIALTTRERRFRHRLLDRAAIADGQRVLDVGCGTGSLLIMAAERHPKAEFLGLDPDPHILSRARAKARLAGAEISFVPGLATDLPFEDSSFDRMLSTLVFHHLGPEALTEATAEISRILRPGGELHLADWAPPRGLVMTTLSWQVRLLDGVARTRPNFDGELPSLFEAAGLIEAERDDAIATAFGTLGLYAFRRPARS